MFGKRDRADTKAGFFDGMAADFQNALKGDLVSLILYGEAATSYSVPEKSDAHCLVILTETGLDHLERVIAVVRKWRKKRVVCAFMTQAYIASSIDAYPVEFLNMQLYRRVLFGADVLAGLTFPRHDLRLQLEREVKGKIFHLRQGFLECEGKEKGLQHLIKVSLNAFLPLFKALLFFAEYEIPPGRRDVIASLSRAYAINTDVFLRCYDLQAGAGRFAAGEVKDLFTVYLGEMVKLAALIDKLDV